MLYNDDLGDVYIATVLMGNISAGIVEGLSERKWVDSIFCENDLNHYTNNNSIHPSTYRAMAWYQAWIYLHSTLLRSIALTADERTQLGLSENGTTFTKRASPLRDTDYSDNTVRFFPPAPFRGVFTSRTFMRMHRKLKTDDGRLTVLFRDFAALGPTFRGR